MEEFLIKTATDLFEKNYERRMLIRLIGGIYRFNWAKFIKPQKNKGVAFTRLAQWYTYEYMFGGESISHFKGIKIKVHPMVKLDGFIFM